MTYDETIEFLFSQLAMYQKQGPSAYKPGLATTETLDAAFGSPSCRLKVIHVAGTNGKGSTSHSIASVLQAAGLKTGLFTSPHLLDFRERIRINGEMIPQEEVVSFVERYFKMNLELRPSFFELTTIMAFDWFARSGVDVAIIEVGLGGRLDSTNIVKPLISVITNISLDHTALLGATTAEIATEKAGIIKSGTDVVIGEAEGAVRRVFELKAEAGNSPITFATDRLPFSTYKFVSNGIEYYGTPFGDIKCDLCGSYQPANMATVLTTLNLLKNKGIIELSEKAVKKGLADVALSTGLMGRWMTLYSSPLTICDTGHNIGGWEYLASKLQSIPGHKNIVIGFVNDKDVSAVMRLISSITDASFFFTQASVERALPPASLASIALKYGIIGNTYATVADAYEDAKAKSSPDDIIFVGGSTFIVADFLQYIKDNPLTKQ